MRARTVRWVIAGTVLGVPLASQEAGSPRETSRDDETRIELEGHAVTLEGFVYTPEGVPAEGAVVVTSAGGQAVADPSGHYVIEARLPEGAESVQVTAVGRGGQNLVASARISVSTSTAWASVDPLSLALNGSCSPDWLPTLGEPAGTNGFVNALVVYDDGTGPALYAGGEFTMAGNVAANRIARWDGASWSALGSGVDGNVFALSVYDDGAGTALYAAGGFMTAGGLPAVRIARWDGSVWTPLGSGTDQTILALTVHDDGSGPALYAGGHFTIAGGTAANRIARWDGSSWSRLGSGAGNTVSSLAVYDDGGGPALYAGGSFTTAGGVSASRIARWNGQSWSALAGGGLNGGVTVLAVYDDSRGPALFAAGTFTTAGSVPVSNIARWNGTTWADVGGGLSGGPFPWVFSMMADSHGDLYVAGNFKTAGGVPTNYIARWDGSTWSALEQEVNDRVHALAEYDDGHGPVLYAGGFLTTAGDTVTRFFARWDGSSWSNLGNGLDGFVKALAVHDDGSGPALYAGGSFTAHVVRWNGSHWQALGSGLNGDVGSLTVYDDGGGSALYAGGAFNRASSVFNTDGVVVNRVARWDGSSWSALGSGTNSTIMDMEVFDDGSGESLYVVGLFSRAGGLEARYVARWDGSGWSTLGNIGLNNHASALAVFDDGNGPGLYVAGNFGSAGTEVANRIARWDSGGWWSVGSGLNGNVSALAVYDDGRGPALYAGGSFTTAGGRTANRIARWDGSSWSNLGSGLNDSVYGLTVYDDGGSPVLCAGGLFTSAGSVAARRLARWNGSTWSAFGGGLNDGVVYSLTVLDAGTRPSLWVGGTFTSPIDSDNGYLARWGLLPDTTPPLLDCAPVFARDSGAPGEIVTFSVTASDDDCLDPDPLTTCVPASGSFFPPGVTTVLCTSTDLSGNQATCQFPVVVGVKPVLPR